MKATFLSFMVTAGLLTLSMNAVPGPQQREVASAEHIDAAVGHAQEQADEVAAELGLNETYEAE